MPTLVNAVTVRIRPLDRDAERFDPDAREAVRTVRPRAVLELPAQVSFREEDRPDPTAPGVTLRSRGSLVMRLEDLTFIGYEPARGDRIEAVGDMAVDLYVVETLPFAFRTEVGGPTLLKLKFADRSPVS